jgi:plastocyanin
MRTTPSIPRAVRVPVLLTASLAALAFTAGCGGGSTKATHASAAGGAGAQAGVVQNVALKIAGGKMAKQLGYTTPDGKGHDTYIPSSFGVKVGEKVIVTVTNYDEGPHTFTAPDLGLNANIPGATNADKGIPSKTTFTFVVKKAGKFRWYCALPCDKKANGWAMTPTGTGADRDGYMAGYVTAS